VGGDGAGSSRAAAATEAVQVRRLLDANTEELSSVVKALNGEYILPEAGGDLLRDGPGVLPTGVPADPVCVRKRAYVVAHSGTMSEPSKAGVDT
jgi:CobN/Magnesium Chelatase